MPDYYCDDQIEGLFGNVINLWERVMLACFYYTGMREAEVSHLYWTDVRWEASEIRVREKPEWQWTTKTYQDRDIEAPQQLMEILREAFEVRDTNSKLIFPNVFGRPEGHFLDALQKIAYRAKITCGECRNCRQHKGRNCQEFAKTVRARSTCGPATAHEAVFRSECVVGTAHIAHAPQHRRRSVS
jgi:integrase